MLRSSFFILLLVVVFISGCKTKPQPKTDDSEYSAYISAYTAGRISRNSSIKVVFQDQVVKEKARKEASSDWISFEPKLNGRLVWSGQNTLEFVPDEALPSGTSYSADLRLDQLMDVPSNLKSFKFYFRTLDQGISVQITGIGAYSPDKPVQQYVSGTAHFSDFIENEKVENAFKALQNGREKSVAWRHESGKQHHFTIDSVQRAESAGELEIEWNNKVLGTEGTEKLKQRIPGFEDFDVINMRLVQNPDQHVIILLSDPVDPKQNLRGHFTINGDDNLRIVKEGNEIHLFPSYRITGSATVEVRKSLKSSLGYNLINDHSRQIQFESLKPAVRFNQVNKTILPSGNKNTIAFDAVSLSAVDVRVIRVFNNNLHQFMQVNSLNGSSELKRVGRVIKRKTVELSSPDNADLGNWNTFYLDLDELIQQEPGALYRVELGFRKAHSLYPCEDSDEDEELATDEDNWDSDGDEEASYWDYFDNWYYDVWDDYNDYDYRERENPCNNSYYRQFRFASRNIFSTDLAIIAKSGENGHWHAWVNDMMTTAPVSTASVKWFNYQGQLLHEGVTDKNGKASWKSENQTPFMLVAEQGKQKSYLKVPNGESLSLARFDVSGESTQSGMKGFIYGERGVWRPGDTLFLSFMLQEGSNAIPQNHPIRLEVVDARGKVVFSGSQPSGLWKHMSWSVPTNDEAPTGSWQARVRVGNAVFNKWLRVETIKPNRLKIALNFADDILHPAGQAAKTQGDLAVEWLHGAPGKNLRTVIEMGLSSARTSFDKYPEFTFDDPSRKLESANIEVFDDLLDSDGKAKVNLNVQSVDEAPGMLRATFNTRAFEPGGDFSTDVFSIPFSPYQNYIGLRLPKGDAARNMLLTDTTHTILVQSVTHDGRPAGRMALSYEIYKVEWRWWWQSGEDDLSTYSGRSSMNLIRQGNFETNDKGEGGFDFKINYPEWGRYLVRVIDQNGGHACGKTMYVDWPGWAGRAQRDNAGAETTLSITSDKDVYIPGQKATVTYPGAEKARALITVENGEGVLKSWWEYTTAGSNSLSIDIEEGYAPNVYVSISLIQPHGQTENDNPMRLYGTHRISVENPKTRIEPLIAMKPSLEPETEYRISVSESSGKAMSYTLAVVDEGLLGLTRFKTPDPHGHFYAREVLGVKTWDLYDEVIGAYGKAMKHALTIGGGGELEAGAKKKVNRFKPVVSFIGPFQLKPGQTLNHDLFMPNYVGAVRVMVVARNADAYGHAEKTVQVKKPLMVLATLPRIVGPGESLELPVNVFAMEDQVKNVDIQINTGGLIEVKSAASKKMSFNRIGDQVINFTLQSRNAEGATFVEVLAKSGSNVARHRIDFEVRNPNPPMTVRYNAVVEAGQSFNQLFDLPGIEGSNSIKLEVSSFKPINLGERLQYLIGYPHGCLEQTTSRAFPQLYLEDAVQMTDQEKMRARQHVAAAIGKLQTYQNANGGFGYWPGAANANDWSTSYVGHFMIAAKEKGHAVSDGMLKSWVNYQDEIARNWRPESSQSSNYDYSLPQSYRLYTLALAGKPNIGAMNRLREYKYLSETSRWQLAAAYLMAGQQSAADDLMKRSTVQLNESTHLTADYGSYDRDLALIARALISAGKRNEAAPIILKLTDRLNASRWMSTQETAFILAAVGEFMAGENLDPVVFDYTFNGKKVSGVNPAKPTYIIELPAVQAEKNNFQFKNASGRSLYVQLAATGQPIEDQSPEESNGLELKVRYLTTDGEVLDIKKLEQGTDFVAAVTVSQVNNRAVMRDIALTQVFPSGWEIINERMSGIADGRFENSHSTYRDIRDDRVNTYFDLKRNGTVTYYVRLNAAYLGRFFLPTTSVEMMYEGAVNARTRGQWVEVIRAGVL